MSRRTRRVGASRRRALRWVGGVGLVALLVGVLMVLPTLVFPETVALPRDVDAVVVFAGGQGERLEAALGLMDRAAGPVAPQLWISSGADPSWPRANRLCGTDQGAYQVGCATPAPGDTRGEARMVAELAERFGWGEVAVVTSRYHVTRSRLWLRRCWGGPAVLVGAAARLDWRDAARVHARELAALARDTVVRRSCEGS